MMCTLKGTSVFGLLRRLRDAASGDDDEKEPTVFEGGATAVGSV